MIQEFHLSITPIGNEKFLIRTERVAPGVPLAEEQVTWAVDHWLEQVRHLMTDPLSGILQGFGVPYEKLSANGQQLAIGNSWLEMGQLLYQSLFQKTLRDSWVTAQGIAHNRNELLRLRLGIKDSRLAGLPWEVLHEGDSGLRESGQGRMLVATRPVATGLQTLFSRYQPLQGLGSSALPAALSPDVPLRILMVIAIPGDRDRLNLKREVQQLQQELALAASERSDNGQPQPTIQVTVLEQPGREQLTQALEQRQFHAFHFAGHSHLDDDGGYLHLVHPQTGLTELLSGDDLAGLLTNNGIRLAVLNSCQGAASTASSDPLSTERSLATSLVKRGIPAVLAMAEKIPDDVALTLSRLFYRNLSQRYPIDLSLSRARQGLISSYGSEQLYWALPVLYLHPEFDGRLWLDPPNFSHREDFGADHPELELDAYLNSELASDELASSSDLSAVARLIQQLSTPSDPEEPLLADVTEQLLPDPEHDALALYNRIPERPLARRNPLPQTLTQLAPVAEADAADDVELLPYETEQRSQEHAWPQPHTVLFEQSQRALSGQRVKRAQKNRVWAAIAAGSCGIALIAIALLVQRWDQVISIIPSPSVTADETVSPSESASASPEAANEGEVTAIATEGFVSAAAALSQGDEAAFETHLATAQQAVEALLEQGNLTFAETALEAALNPRIDHPTVSFLWGRLAWQAWQTGTPDYYSLDDARRYWEMALDADPQSVVYQNAVGIAYYAMGQQLVEQSQPDQARKYWLNGLSMLENTTDCTTQATGCAIKALILFRLGSLSSQPDAALIQEAQQWQHDALQAEPQTFQTTTFSQNWQWPVTAIDDWLALLATN